MEINDGEADADWSGGSPSAIGGDNHGNPSFCGLPQNWSTTVTRVLEGPNIAPQKLDYHSSTYTTYTTAASTTTWPGPAGGTPPPGIGVTMLHSVLSTTTTTTTTTTFISTTHYPNPPPPPPPQRRFQSSIDGNCWVDWQWQP
ncbi:hypothetical protein V496_03432 [Pseudogymnoascus sp. VKM F-4515 (FW-2607)]|nr:hypothetical protein V496_03432 [Pseudogymnoascus sp. VKM F-4515 (FW-2607)]